MSLVQLISILTGCLIAWVVVFPDAARSLMYDLREASANRLRQHRDHLQTQIDETEARLRAIGQAEGLSDDAIDAWLDGDRPTLIRLLGKRRATQLVQRFEEDL